MIKSLIINNSRGFSKHIKVIILFIKTKTIISFL